MENFKHKIPKKNQLFVIPSHKMKLMLYEIVKTCVLLNMIHNIILSLFCITLLNNKCFIEYTFTNWCVVTYISRKGVFCNTLLTTKHICIIHYPRNTHIIRAVDIIHK